MLPLKDFLSQQTTDTGRQETPWLRMMFIQK